MIAKGHRELLRVLYIITGMVFCKHLSWNYTLRLGELYLGKIERTKKKNASTLKNKALNSLVG